MRNIFCFVVVHACGSCNCDGNKVCLVFSFGTPHCIVQGPFPGEQVGGVSAPEARLNVENRHVSPAGGVVVGTGSRAVSAGFALDQLEEGLHVRAQPSNQAGSHRCNRLLVASLQGLQQGAVVSENRNWQTSVNHLWSMCTVHTSATVMSV